MAARKQAAHSHSVRTTQAARTPMSAPARRAHESAATPGAEGVAHPVAEASALVVAHEQSAKERRTESARGTRGRAASAPQADRPAVAHCAELDTLRKMSAEQAREHVDRYLHTVMSAGEAHAFEAQSYRWELHLVALDQLCLLRTVDLSQTKLRRYRTVLRKNGGFPPLVGLGGEGKESTQGVLLCDGYHRAVAMRDLGLSFAWVWLAVAPWRDDDEAAIVVGAGAEA